MSSITIASHCSLLSQDFQMSTKILPQLRRLLSKPSNLGVMYSSSEGDAGAIRKAGGAFAQKGAAHEDQYFHKIQQEQIAELKVSIETEIKHHEEEIKRHQEVIAKHQKAYADLSGLGDHK